MTRLSFLPPLAFLLAAATQAAVDPALLNLAPPEAKVLYGIQIQATLASPFGQFALRRSEWIALGRWKHRQALGSSNGAGRPRFSETRRHDLASRRTVRRQQLNAWNHIQRACCGDSVSPGNYSAVPRRTRDRERQHLDLRSV